MRYGMLASAFSPFPHPGHLSAMYQAIKSGACDLVIAMVHEDPSVDRPEKMNPALTTKERTYMLFGLMAVRKCFAYRTEEDLRRLYLRCSQWLDVVIILGEDHRGEPYTGQDLMIPVFYANRFPDWSGTKFAQRIWAAVEGIR